MESRFYNYKTHELEDTKILEQLKKMPIMYENGEVAEVQELCDEISEAIQEFNYYYE